MTGWLSRLGRFRLLWTVLAALVLVVVIALVVRAYTAEPDDTLPAQEGPLASLVTGSTDQLTAGEADVISALPAEGRVEPSQAQWEALLPQLEQTAAASPDDVDAQRTLALAYYNLGQYEQAQTIYERLLDAEEDAVLRDRLGNTLRDMGDETGAEETYRLAIADDPALPIPYLNLADILWRRGDDAAALDVIDQGLAAVPEDARASLEAARLIVIDTGD